MAFRSAIAVALLCLAAQHALAQDAAPKEMQTLPEDAINAVNQIFHKSPLPELFPPPAVVVTPPPASQNPIYPATTPSPPPATTAAATTSAPPATTKAPAASTMTPTASTMPPASSTPPPPTTPSTYLPTAVTSSQAMLNQPEVIQLGTATGANSQFPSNSSGPFNLGPNAIRYAVIGDWGRKGAPGSLGQPMCATATYGGSNDVQGGLQQQQVAELADQVCGLLGGCAFVDSTGDNFYECGIYPNDTTNRFTSDWNAIYNTPATPSLNGLTWYTTFGNHDIVINGSVEAEIAYTTTNPKWQLPSNYFFKDIPTAPGQPTIRAFFIDANPFIASYNVAGQKYNQAYFQAHVNPTYINAQNTWLQTNLAASNATYNIVTGHYPLFGTATQYGYTQTNTSTSPYPGNYNGWAMLLQTLYQYKVAAYYNGHDHSMAVGNPAQPGAPQQWNNYTSFLTSGAGSLGQPGDSCGAPGSFFYSDGGNAGFIIVSANTTLMNHDFFQVGSLYSQCTVTTFADKTKPPVYSANCALGKPNACCNATPNTCS